MVKHIRTAPATRGRAEEGHREDFGILLGLAFNAFATKLRAHLEDEGFAELPKSFGYVARNIAETPLTLTELAARLAITSPGALKIVQEMERTGYLERVADPNDARAKRHRLTKRGKAALAAARAFHRKFESDLARRVGVSNVRALREALLDLVEHHEDEASPLAIRPM